MFALFFLPARFWNVFFHVGATIFFRAYCPGVVTALCIYPPVVYLVSRCALKDRLLNAASGAAALVAAGVYHLWEAEHNVFKAW
jgi:hypothetical protein